MERRPPDALDHCEVAFSSVLKEISRKSIGGWILPLAVYLVTRAAAILLIVPTFDEIGQNYITNDIAHLVRFPIYFDGQNYMGPLESYLMAPFFRLFGNTYFHARIYNQIFYLIFAAILLRILWKRFGQEIAFYALSMLCVLPFTALFFTTIVGHAEILMLAALALQMLLAVAEKPQQSAFPAFGLGLVSGLAFWCYGIFIIWMLPTALSLFVLCFQGKYPKRILFFSAAGLFAGLIPCALYFLQTGIFMGMEGGGGKFISLSRIPGLVYLCFARLKYFFASSFISNAPPAVKALNKALSFYPTAVFLAAFLGGVFYYLRTFRQKNPAEKILWFYMILPVPILLVLYSLRDLTQDEGMRLFLPLLVSFVFFMSVGLKTIKSLALRRLILGGLLGTWLVTDIFSFQGQALKLREANQIVEFLSQKDLRYGLGDMKISYTLNILSRGALTVSPIQPFVRYKPLWEEVETHGASFFVTDRNGGYSDLLTQSSGLQKQTMGDYEVFYGPSEGFKAAAYLQDRKIYR